MNNMKRLLAASLMLLMLMTMTACGGKKEEVPAEEPEAAGQTEENQAASDTKPETPEENGDTAEESDPVVFSVAALKGPTGMGLVRLMDEFGVAPTIQDEPVSKEALENRAEKVGYAFTLAAAADEITPSLISGKLDIACVPANLAAVLYKRTNGGVVTLGINTLGVLYIVENGTALSSLEGLKGKTIVAAGKGSVPEYGLRYLLTENGIDPDKDVTIEWKSEHSECVAALASGAASIAMLPQPFVTVAQNKLPDVRIALDLTAEWEALEDGSAMITGVVVARREVVETFPEAVEVFLQDYAESVEWVNTNTEEAAQLIGTYGIVDAAVAEKALPYCNIVCIAGEEMKEKLSGYLDALEKQAPEAVGGKVPEDDFYYGV